MVSTLNDKPIVSIEALKFISEYLVPYSFRQCHATYEWHMKEYGSWEDHNCDPNHPCQLVITKNKKWLSIPKVIDLIISGDYNATSWEDDEISGGAATKRIIANHVTRLSLHLKHAYLIIKDKFDIDLTKIGKRELQTLIKQYNELNAN